VRKAVLAPTRPLTKFDEETGAHSLLPQRSEAALFETLDAEIGLGRVVEATKEGRRTTTIVEVGAAIVRIKAFAPTILIDGQEPPPPAPGSSDGDKWLSLASRDRGVEKALAIWGSKPRSWFWLWKVDEIVKGRADISGEGWASKNELRRFRHTANDPVAGGEDARHARVATSTPRRAMKLTEAEALIERIHSSPSTSRSGQSPQRVPGSRSPRSSGSAPAPPAGAA
jgi:hypothetical protein